MTEQQKIHIAMINSYNVIVGNVDIDDVLDSNVSLFSHDFEEELQYDNMVFILKYFEQIEMFDKCIILSAFIDKTFDKTGKHKEKDDNQQDAILQMACCLCDVQRRGDA